MGMYRVEKRGKQGRGIPQNHLWGERNKCLPLWGGRQEHVVGEKNALSAPNEYVGAHKKSFGGGIKQTTHAPQKMGTGGPQKKFWKDKCEQQICKDIGDLESSWGGRKNTKYTNQTQDTNKINIHAQNY